MRPLQGRLGGLRPRSSGPGRRGRCPVLERGRGSDRVEEQAGRRGWPSAAPSGQEAARPAAARQSAGRGSACARSELRSSACVRSTRSPCRRRWIRPSSRRPSMAGVAAASRPGRTFRTRSPARRVSGRAWTAAVPGAVARGGVPGEQPPAWGLARRVLRHARISACIGSNASFSGVLAAMAAAWTGRAWALVKGAIPRVMSRAPGDSEIEGRGMPSRKRSMLEASWRSHRPRARATETRGAVVLASTPRLRRLERAAKPSLRRRGLALGLLACCRVGRQQVGTVYGRVLALLPRRQAGFFVRGPLFMICV